MDEKYLLLTFNSVNHTMQLEKELKNTKNRFLGLDAKEERFTLK